MTNINLYGGIFGATGYDSHTRQLVNALYRLNSSIYLESPRPADWLRHVNSAEAEMMQNQPFKKATDIMINLPPFYALCTAQKPKHFIGWCVWEGTNIPAYWQEHLEADKVDCVITPSLHTKNAILNTFKPTNPAKYKVIPHGVDTALYKPIEQPKSPVFRVFCNKGWAIGAQDRGGLQWALKAFCEEFIKEKDIELLVKINTAYCPPGWSLATELQKLGLTPANTKNVKFITDQIPYKNLPALYQNSDLFLSPTMGDGFNLPCLESMACGVPCVTTNFGGQTDYMNDDNGWLIDYDLIPVTWDINYEGNQWAMPKIEHLKKTLRYCYEHQDEVKTKGTKARETAELYTWNSSAKKLLDVINELE